MIIAFLVFVIFFFNFKGLGYGYWDTYIILPSALMVGDQIELTDINGGTLYDIGSTGSIKTNLIDKETYGISTKDQRIGSAIFYSIPYLLFGKIGFRIFYSLLGGLLFILTYFITEKVLENKNISIISGLILALNPYILNVNRLNPNLLALTLITFMMFLLVEKDKNDWILLGMLLGVLGGIRNVSLLFIPSFIFFMVFGSKLLEIKNKNNKILLKNFSLFVFGALLFIIPILLWNNYVFGGILEHPTQSEYLQGYRPTFEHSLLGVTFKFNGLFNYPLIDKVIRTPHNAYPTFLTLPLLLLKSFGLLFLPLILFGIKKLYSKDKKLLFFLLIFTIPYFLFLSVQENWEDVKSTFILLIYTPLIILMTAGIYELKKLDKKKIITFSVILIFSLIFLQIISNINFEKDDRWYERFPKAGSIEEFNYEDPLMRDEWQYFHTDESIQEIETQKNILTYPNFLPQYNILSLPNLNNIYNELNNEKLVLNEVWDHIY
ncbi:hypothetical protein C0585_07775 [Candidatus Woesearchaeota archaeon]|nr:MAG: hypothetical protein C0585_07775 [Candidatus Woesearchaeota archaeon]